MAKQIDESTGLKHYAEKELKLKTLVDDKIQELFSAGLERRLKDSAAFERRGKIDLEYQARVLAVWRDLLKNALILTYNAGLAEKLDKT